jgi:hypothetical protein
MQKTTIGGSFRLSKLLKWLLICLGSTESIWKKNHVDTIVYLNQNENENILLLENVNINRDSN